MGRELGVLATNDKEALYALEPDCIVHTAMVDDRIFEAIADLTEMVERGINVVSSGPVLLLLPEGARPRRPRRRDRRRPARRPAPACTSTASTPGWANDVLPLALTSLSQRIDLVRVSEIADYSTYYQPVVMNDIYGFGKPMDHVRDALAAGDPDHGVGSRRTPDRGRVSTSSSTPSSRRSSSASPPTAT